MTMAMESRYAMTREHESHDPNFIATQPDMNLIDNPALKTATTPVERRVPCHSNMFDHIVAQFDAQAKEWAAADTPEKKTAFIDKYDPPRKAKEKRKKAPGK